MRACLSFPSSLHVTPSFLFSSLFFLSVLPSSQGSLFRFCFPVPGLAPSRPARWSAPRAGAQAQPRPRGAVSRGCRLRGAEGARPGRGAASRMGGAGRAGRPCYICACAAPLRSQSGRRRQDGAAPDAGDREPGRARATHARQWAGGGVSRAGAGSDPELPRPASPQ